MQMPDRQERHYKPMPLSPEQSARHTADRMDSLLKLTEKQYDKLYKLNLKWAREEMKNKAAAPRMDGRPDGAPGFGGGMGQGFGGGMGQGPRGNRPPAGMDRRPPRDFGPMPDDREEMETLRRRREKQLKKILTGEQYARWTEDQDPLRPEWRPNR